MAGRPTTYTPEIGKSICESIATSSKSMKTICSELNLSINTVLDWLDYKGDNEHIKGFSQLYARAKELQADYLFEEMIEIADDGSNDYMTITKGDQTYNVEDKEVTNRSKLRIDVRKFAASKLRSKKYGDKLELSGDQANPIHVITGMKIE